MSFERIKPPQERLDDPDADPQGRAALFSAGRPAATGPAVRLHCSRCGRWSALDPAAVLRSALPLFLVAPWRDHPIFAICPAGRHRAWLRPSLSG